MMILKGKLHLRRWLKSRQTRRLNGLIIDLLEQERILLGRTDLLQRVRVVRVLLERARMATQIEVEDLSEQIETLQSMQALLEQPLVRPDHAYHFQLNPFERETQQVLAQLGRFEREARQILEDFRP